MCNLSGTVNHLYTTPTYWYPGYVGALLYIAVYIYMWLRPVVSIYFSQLALPLFRPSKLFYFCAENKAPPLIPRQCWVFQKFWQILGGGITQPVKRASLPAKICARGSNLQENNQGTSIDTKDKHNQSHNHPKNTPKPIGLSSDHPSSSPFQHHPTCRGFWSNLLILVAGSN